MFVARTSRCYAGRVCGNYGRWFRCGSFSIADPLSLRDSSFSSRPITSWAASLFGPSPITWTQAVSSAEKLVQPSGGPLINPRDLVGNDLALLTNNIRRLLGTGHPVLETISNYYFSKHGKHIRPLIVLLMSQATAIAPKSSFRSSIGFTSNPSVSVDTPVGSASEPLFTPTTEVGPPESNGILPTQRRLAEITEMIHTASLLHDDVIDEAELRRSQSSANARFGNKMAILAGDFLLARASVALSRLRNLEVVELLATVISNLVEGELMQLRNTPLSATTDASELMVTKDAPVSLWLAADTRENEEQKRALYRFEYYMQKSYMKTASLIAKSCRASAVLGGCADEVGDMAYQYGRCLGLAFQLVDDMLDFVVSADEFGKPVNADLQLGLATAPVLFAAESSPELWPLIERNFKETGDVDVAKERVFQSDSIQRTRKLAAKYCENAVEALSGLPDSPAKLALIQLTNSVLTRKK
ncbi:isoprenoid synthase domain-containing protein [Cladochytrium replicatum]|nr:isoprenoid synthase domain-containing protein [Cladochytrium replicatum]